MHDYARPARIRLPLDQLIGEYERGLTLAAVGKNHGVSYTTVSRRLREAGVKLRSPSEVAVYDDRQAKEVKALWEAGRPVAEIATQLNVKPWTVYRRLREVGWDSEAKRLKAMYLEQQLPIAVIAARLHHSPSTVSAKLKALGVVLRNPAGKVRQPVAPTSTVRAIQTATVVRRLGGSSTRELTPKQRDLLDVVRAAPKPISTGCIAEVARDLPREWCSLVVGNIGACLKRLESRGLVRGVWGTRASVRYRGTRVRLWLPASPDIAEPESEQDAARLREIQVLVAEQEQDDKSGHLARITGAISLDAPLPGGGSRYDLVAAA